MDSSLDVSRRAGSYFRLFQRLIAELRKKPDQALAFSFQDRERFQCSACGQCCRQPWRIVVPQDYFQQWFTYFDTHPSGRFAAPFEILPEPSPGQYANMRRQADGKACVFLEEDNRCFIQRQLGAEALPDICRSYPRLNVSLDRRYFFQALLPSCQDVPDLWQETPELQYRFVSPGQMDAPEILAPHVWVRDGCFLRSYAFYLWLGIVLDTLGQGPASPVGNFGQLGHALSLLLLSDLSFLPESYLSLVYREQMRYLAQPSPRDESPSPVRWLQLAASLTYTDGASLGMADLYRRFSPSPDPPLLAEEQEMLARFLGNYLHYSLFLSKNWLNGQVNLFQQTLLTSFSLAFIQLLALYERKQAGTSLQPGHLRRSVNFVSNMIVHKETWRDHPIHRLTPQHCLEGIAALARVDFCPC